MGRKDRPETPDGRFFVARGRLRRKTGPSLSDVERRAAIKALMRARIALRAAQDDGARREAKSAVVAAKTQLGESGPVWWADGAPDEHGLTPPESRYSGWWDALSEDERLKGL